MISYLLGLQCLSLRACSFYNLGFYFFSKEYKDLSLEASQGYSKVMGEECLC